MLYINKNYIEKTQPGKRLVGQKLIIKAGIYPDLTYVYWIVLDKIINVVD